MRSRHLRPRARAERRCGWRSAGAIARVTSSLVILPPGPVPVTVRKSTPASAAMRCATGVALGDLAEVGQHVALGDALAAIAGRRHLCQIDALGSRPACARAVRRRLCRLSFDRRSAAARRGPVSPVGSFRRDGRRLRYGVAPAGRKLVLRLADDGDDGQHRHDVAGLYGARCARCRAPSASTGKIALSVSTSRISWPCSTFAPSSTSQRTRVDFFHRLAELGDEDLFGH